MDPTVQDAIGAVLPLAVGVAFSPLPIIAVVLIAMGDSGRAAAPAFALGRVLGLAAVTAVVVLASDLLYAAAGAASLPTIVKLLIGLALIVLGVTKWRPKPDAGLPGWMQAVQSASPGRALGYGVLVTVVNPKELALLVAAGATLGATPLSPGEEALVGLVVVLVAALTTLLPAIAVLVAPGPVRPLLDGMRTWLSANHGVVMGILLIVIGTVVLGGAISAL